MNTVGRRFLPGAVWTILAAALICGCSRMSVIERDETAGFNGGYETVISGLPANWYIYRPPFKNGDISISFDAMDAIEGEQSLKLDVNRVDSAGGWRSPGLFQVLPAKSKQTYKVTFWLKNQGSRVSLLIGSEKPKSATPAHRRVLGGPETGTNLWRQFEYKYTVPPNYENIRFELNIVEPGTLWIDDVKIEQVQAETARP